jgi:hypothetical protein
MPVAVSAERAGFWHVLFLLLQIIGIALVVLGAIILIRYFVHQAKATRKLQHPWVRGLVKFLQQPWVWGLAIIIFGGIFFWAGVILPSQIQAPLGENSVAEGLTAVGTVSGDAVTAVIAATSLFAVILLRKAVTEQTKQLKASAVQNVGHEALKIDRWMADHLEYLYALNRPEADQSARGAAVAEVYADFIDQVVSQEDYLPPSHMPPWREYFGEIIQTWPQLKKYMKDNPDWYLDTMNELLPLYRADDRGLKPGSPTTSVKYPNHWEYTYGTTNLEIARALAALAAAHNDNRSIYSIYMVELDQPILWERAVKQRAFAKSRGGTVTKVVEEDPAMTLAKAKEVMSSHVVWAADDSPIYDAEGYANVPPGKSEACSEDERRDLGLYPPPPLITMWADHIAAAKERGTISRRAFRVVSISRLRLPGIGRRR